MTNSQRISFVMIVALAMILCAGSHSSQAQNWDQSQYQAQQQVQQHMQQQGGSSQDVPSPQNKAQAYMNKLITNNPKISADSLWQAMKGAKDAGMFDN